MRNFIAKVIYSKDFKMAKSKRQTDELDGGGVAVAEQIDVVALARQREREEAQSERDDIADAWGCYRRLIGMESPTRQEAEQLLEVA